MSDQFNSAIRSVLKLAGGYFIAKGLTDSNNVEIIISGVVALAGVVWSYVHHSAAAPKP